MQLNGRSNIAFSWQRRSRGFWLPGGAWEACLRVTCGIKTADSWGLPGASCRGFLGRSWGFLGSPSRHLLGPSGDSGLLGLWPHVSFQWHLGLRPPSGPWGRRNVGALWILWRAFAKQDFLSVQVKTIIMQIAYKQVLLMLIERDKNEGNHLTNPEPGDTIYCVLNN